MIYLSVRDCYGKEILFFHFFPYRTKKNKITLQANVPAYNTVTSYCHLFWHLMSEIPEFLKELENCSEFPVSGTNIAGKKVLPLCMTQSYLEVLSLALTKNTPFSE